MHALPWKQFAIVAAIALIGASFFHFFYANIADPDSFYHARHAETYLTDPFDSSTGWTKYSVLSERSDIWYGFHLVLAPFMAGDLDLGMRFAGVFLTTLFVLVLWFVLRRHKLPYPWLWPLVAFFVVPNAMYFFLMVRPHMLSLVATLLLLSFLVRGKPHFVGLAAAAIPFFHESFFWLPGFVFGAWMSALLVSSRIEKEPISWKRILVNLGLVLFGTAAGIFLRPEPIAGWEVAWIQMVDLMRLSLSGVPLISGLEMQPLGLTVFTTAFLMLLLWLATLSGGAWALIKRKIQESELRILLVGSGILSLSFGILAIFLAMRAFTLWIVFTVLAFAVCAKAMRWRDVHAKIAVGFIIVILVPYALYRHSLNQTYVATPPEKFQDAALWLSAHSSENDLVFNTHWDQFGPLIHFNTKNIYVGGMHSIFQYAYNPILYWMYHYISLDIAGSNTCPEWPCRKEHLVDTYEILKQFFNPKYVFVEPQRNPYFREYLAADNRYSLVYANEEAEIYEIK